MLKFGALHRFRNPQLFETVMKPLLKEKSIDVQQQNPLLGLNTPLNDPEQDIFIGLNPKKNEAESDTYIVATGDDWTPIDDLILRSIRSHACVSDQDDVEPQYRQALSFVKNLSVMDRTSQKVGDYYFVLRSTFNRTGSFSFEKETPDDVAVVMKENQQSVLYHNGIKGSSEQRYQRRHRN